MFKMLKNNFTPKQKRCKGNQGIFQNIYEYSVFCIFANYEIFKFN
jgi:hypothetical protein